VSATSHPTNALREIIKKKNQFSWRPRDMEPSRDGNLEALEKGGLPHISSPTNPQPPNPSTPNQDPLTPNRKPPSEEGVSQRMQQAARYWTLRF
jgi:hypothetical protein